MLIAFPLQKWLYERALLLLPVLLPLAVIRIFLLSLFNQIHPKIFFNSEMGTNNKTGFVDVSVDRNYD
jgi:ABC-type sulfate transport system permease component